MWRVGSLSWVKAPKIVPSTQEAPFKGLRSATQQSVHHAVILSLIIPSFRCFDQEQRIRSTPGHMKHTRTAQHQPHTHRRNRTSTTQDQHRLRQIIRLPIYTPCNLRLFAGCTESLFCDWIGMYIDMLDDDIGDRPLFLSHGRLLHHI